MALQDILVPDIGDFADVEIIEVLVSPGDSIEVEDSLITVESDKASMEIPSTGAGIVKEVCINVGDSVAEGSVIVRIEASEASTSDTGDTPPATEVKNKETTAQVTTPEPVEETENSEPDTVMAPEAEKPTTSANKTPPTAAIDEIKFSKAYASPSVRRFARELGVDLGSVQGSGRKQRILREDVKSFVKTTLQKGISVSNRQSNTLGIAPQPEIDFSQWGDTETIALNKINKLTGQHLHRSWVTVPHVTQFDEADITELEAFRKQSNADQQSGAKITPLAFIVKACVASLKAFPRFNSSLDHTGENLIQKNYYHIGVAVDTPAGLVVPVIRDVDTKSVVEISNEIRKLASLARHKKLKPSDMQGGCFTISSLGGIGGTKFTPIVNAPEVAILGVSRSNMQPVWDGSAFQPRLMLPLSLSYDHRVIDGADGARFTTHLSQLLSDIRRLIL